MTKRPVTRPAPDGVAATLAARGTTHGDYEVNAALTQATKDLWRSAPGWQRLAPHQRETLDMTAHKVARILCGDPDFADHWHDVAGYSVLTEGIVKKKTTA